MVVKVNFELPVFTRIQHCTQKSNKQFQTVHVFLLCVASLFCLFTIFCTVKIILISREILTVKALLKNNESTMYKLSAKLSKKRDAYVSFYNFLIKQLPSIELILLFQEALSTCSGISVNMISADCYGVNLSGRFHDSSELNRFVEMIGKSLLVSSVDNPVIKDTGDETQTDFTLFIKLNSMRYVITNDPLIKQK